MPPGRGEEEGGGVTVVGSISDQVGQVVTVLHHPTGLVTDMDRGPRSFAACARATGYPAHTGSPSQSLSLMNTPSRCHLSPGRGPAVAQLVGIDLPEFAAPLPHRLVGSPQRHVPASSP
jgi:hypothetical protein